jgi:hypothetical protein
LLVKILLSKSRKSVKDIGFDKADAPKTIYNLHENTLSFLFLPMELFTLLLVVSMRNKIHWDLRTLSTKCRANSYADKIIFHYF